MKKRYKLNLKLLSPVHIGTGEVYEPMNYIISTDENGKNYMYVFDEFEFYRNLGDDDKKQFMNLVEKSGVEAILGIHKFIKEREGVIANISYKKIIALNSVVEEYNKKLATIVQASQNTINKLEIYKTYTSPNSNKALILGSSLKGAISTAYQKFNPNANLKEVFKNLIISDSNGCSTFVGTSQIVKRHIATNIAKKENLPKQNLQLSCKDMLEAKMQNQSQKSQKPNENEIKPIYEAIAPCQTLTEIIIKDDLILDISNLAKCCNNHYLPIFQTIFSDKNSSTKISSVFKEKYQNLKLSENQFLLRVGKHSGKRAVIAVSGKEETTTWLINSLPFGWVLCEYNEI